MEYKYTTKIVDSRERLAIGVRQSSEDDYVLLDEFNIHLLSRMINIHKEKLNGNKASNSDPKGS